MKWEAKTISLGKENRYNFKRALPIPLNEDYIKKITQFKQWLSSKRYSENTIKTYCEALQTFLIFYHNFFREDATFHLFDLCLWQD